MQKLAIEYLLKTKDRFPDKTAVVDAGAHITFSALWEQSLLLAHWLRQTVGHNNIPVVINIPKSLKAVIALLAIQLSGNIYVPFDPATPPARRRRMLASLGDCPIIEPAENGYKINNDVYTEGRVDQVGPLGDVEASILANLRYRASISPLYIIFTSGTTGTPKGVTVSNGAAIDYIDWAAQTYDVTEREVIGNQAPLFFDNSVLDLYLSFARGCTLHLIPNERFLFLPEVVDYIATEKINFIFFVPSLLANLAQLDLLKQGELHCLKKVLFAGEPMPLNTLRYLRKRLPHALLSNLYGPTEITVDAIYWIFGDEIDGLENVPLGRPCENKEILLIDDDGRPIPGEDAVGEICVTGIGVALGYWNDPHRSDEVFIQNPRHNLYREIAYKTGDLAYVSSQDGLIYMTGRKDNQIKHMGYRIEPGEIENALNNIDVVSQCCIQYDAPKREIVAFYTTANDGTIRDPRQLLADDLPKYMMPRRFIRVSRFPMTKNGKIDKRMLWKEYKSNEPHPKNVLQIS